MQSYFVYIIYSLSGDCYYRGFSENPLHRLEQHRNGESRYTSKFCDPNLVALIDTALIRNQELNVLMQEIEVSKNEVRKAKGEILPTAGFNAFSPRVWFNPESILLNLVGDLVAPLINRNALKANYYSANARQNQAVFEYERSILNAYIEVVNQLSKLEKYNSSFNTKQKEVDLLNQSVDISNSLFSSARADYMEVLLTQRETIDATMDLIEIKLMQLNAKIDLYRSLGGGWK